jgi:hypothetical protein
LLDSEGKRRIPRGQAVLAGIELFDLLTSENVFELLAMSRLAVEVMFRFRQRDSRRRDMRLRDQN